MVRAPGCGPGDRGFEPHHPPHFSPATRCERALGRGQAVRHETLTLALAGSTPAAPAMFDPLAQLAEHLTFNQGVRGSNPRWVTRKNRSFLMMRDGRFCFLRGGLRPQPCVYQARFPRKRQGRSASSLLPLFFIDRDRRSAHQRGRVFPRRRHRAPIVKNFFRSRCPFGRLSIREKPQNMMPKPAGYAPMYLAKARSRR